MEENQEKPKKKRASGKRKPKPKPEVVQPVVKEEEVKKFDPQGDIVQQITDEIDRKVVDGLLEINTEAALNLANVIQSEKQPMKEVVMPLPELSAQAMKWKVYLEYQKIEPKVWLEKYPNNKFKHLIEEIVRYEENKK